MRCFFRPAASYNSFDFRSLLLLRRKKSNNIPKREMTHEEVVSATTKRKTDREFVLEYLKSGKTLNTIDAREIYGIQAIATRVFELRKKGYDIKTKFIKTASGEQVAEYSL